MGNSTLASCSAFLMAVSRAAFNSSSGFFGSGGGGWVCPSRPAAPASAAKERRVSFAGMLDRITGQARSTAVNLRVVLARMSERCRIPGVLGFAINWRITT
jgi:hypothetical protein